jgi:hypothetical protein
MQARCIVDEAMRKKWCPNADLNHGHADFQSAALPTELFGHLFALLSDPLGEAAKAVRLWKWRGYNTHFRHVQHRNTQQWIYSQTSSNAEH